MRQQKGKTLAFATKFGILFKNYRFQSIFFRYFTSIFATFVVIVVAAIIILFVSSINSNKMVMENDARAKATSFGNSWNLVMQYVDTYHSSILQDGDLTRVLVLHEDQYAPKIYLALQTECAKNPFFESIYVYRIQDHAFFPSIPNTQLSKSNVEQLYSTDFYDKAWLSYVDESKTKIIPRIIQDTNRMVISIIKPVKIGLDHVGYICYNLRYKYFAQTLNDLLQNNTTDTILLTTADEMIVFSSDQARFKSLLTDSDDGVLLTDNKSPFIQKQATTFFNRLSYEQMKLVYILNPNAQLLAPANIVRFILIAFPIALLLCVLLSALLSSTMYDYIVRILNYFDLSTVQSVESASGELSDIQNKLMRMIKNNAHIETEYAQKLIDLKKAQTIALQTQINPHFVLNTLQLVSLLQISEHGEDTESVYILNLMSDIFRSNLRAEEYTISVKEEIELAEKYLSIEEYCHGDSLDVIWDVAPEAYEQSILRFTLQPLLENILQHGFSGTRQTEKQINISIKVVAQGGRWIVIVVKDNGHGMSEARLNEIRDMLEKPFIPENKRIGIANVNMRLKLIFGAEATMTIDSTEGDGTSVTIRIPA